MARRAVRARRTPVRHGARRSAATDGRARASPTSTCCCSSTGTSIRGGPESLCDLGLGAEAGALGAHRARRTLGLAADDLETATALLSARHLAGGAALSEELVERSRSNWRKRGKRWLPRLAASVAERHRSSGEVRVRPRARPEGRGGLRRARAALGARRRRGGLPSCSPAPRPRTRCCSRCASNCTATSRPDDRLLMEEQGAIARGVLSRAAARTTSWPASPRPGAGSRGPPTSWHDIRLTVDGGRRGRLRGRPIEDGLVLRDGRCTSPGHPRQQRAAAPADDPLLVLRARGGSLTHASRASCSRRSARLLPCPSRGRRGEAGVRGAALDRSRDGVGGRGARRVRPVDPPPAGVGARSQPAAAQRSTASPSTGTCSSAPRPPLARWRTPARPARRRRALHDIGKAYRATTAPWRGPHDAIAGASASTRTTPTPWRSSPATTCSSRRRDPPRPGGPRDRRDGRQRRHPGAAVAAARTRGGRRSRHRSAAWGS